MSSYPVLDPSLHHVMFGAIPSDQRFIISSSDFSSKLVKTPSYDTITFSSIFLAPTMVIVPAHDLSLSLPSDCLSSFHIQYRGPVYFFSFRLLGSTRPSSLGSIDLSCSTYVFVMLKNGGMTAEERRENQRYFNEIQECKVEEIKRMKMKEWLIKRKIQL